MPTLHFPLFFVLRLLIATGLIIGGLRSGDWRMTLLCFWVGLDQALKALTMEYRAQEWQAGEQPLRSRRN